MAAGTAEMADKRTYVSVKIDSEVYRLIKTVASWKGLNVADYLTEIARPVAERDFAKINREISRQAEKKGDNPSAN
jgi:hypothetical protein